MGLIHTNEFTSVLIRKSIWFFCIFDDAEFLYSLRREGSFDGEFILLGINFQDS